MILLRLEGSPRIHGFPTCSQVKSLLSLCGSLMLFNLWKSLLLHPFLFLIGRWESCLSFHFHAIEWVFVTKTLLWNSWLLKSNKASQFKHLTELLACSEWVFALLWWGNGVLVLESKTQFSIYRVAMVVYRLFPMDFLVSESVVLEWGSLIRKKKNV